MDDKNEIKKNRVKKFFEAVHEPDIGAVFDLLSEDKTLIDAEDPKTDLTALEITRPRTTLYKMLYLTAYPYPYSYNYLELADSNSKIKEYDDVRTKGFNVLKSGSGNYDKAMKFFGDALKIIRDNKQLFEAEQLAAHYHRMSKTQAKQLLNDDFLEKNLKEDIEKNTLAVTFYYDMLAIANSPENTIEKYKEILIDHYQNYKNKKTLSAALGLAFQYTKSKDHNWITAEETEKVKMYVEPMFDFYTPTPHPCAQDQKTPYQNYSSPEIIPSHSNFISTPSSSSASSLMCSSGFVANMGVQNQNKPENKDKIAKKRKRHETQVTAKT